jgi:branched-chain amino acid transport system substrate-binding protein
MGPLSGEAAAVGHDNLLGVKAAVQIINEEGGINGKKVILLVEDNKLNEAQSLSIYQKFTKINNVDVILTSDYGAALVLTQNADEEHTVVINSLDTSEELANAGEYLFAIGIHDENIGYEIAKHAVNELEHQNVAIIYNQDPIIALVANSVEQRAIDLGATVTSKQGYVGNENDFRTMLIKAKESGATAIVGLGFDEAGYIFRQAHELQIDLDMLAMDTATSELFLKNAGAGAESLYFSSWDASTLGYQALEGKIQEHFETTPGQPLFTAAGFDATIYFSKAMQHTMNNGNELHTAMLELPAYQGVTGVLQMSEDGIVRTVTEEMFQIQEGDFVKLS